MEERENSVILNIEHKQLKVDSLMFDKTQLVINDEYELKQEKDAYYIVRKQPQYPKTYKECCEILNYIPNSYDADEILVYGYMSDELRNLQKLLVCLHAYWKIAGDEY